MNSYKKCAPIFIIIIVSIVSIVLFPLMTKAEVDPNAQKGDLRCPGGNSSSVCKMYDVNGNEISTANSSVFKVITTETKDGITVKKIVSKTDTLGKLNVKFEASGNFTKTREVQVNSYVVVIRDVSTSMEETQRNASINAAKEFATSLIEGNSEVNLALIQFSNTLSNNSSAAFSQDNFDKLDFCISNKQQGCNIIHSPGSNIHLAFARAKTLLDGVPADAKKYVVILGDGRYWYSDSSQNWATTSQTELQSLINVGGIEFYGLYYKANFEDKKVGSSRVSDSNNLCNKDDYFPACDQKIMENIVGDSCGDGAGKCRLASTVDDYSTIFESISTAISNYTESETYTVSYEIFDNVGSKFKSSTGIKTNKINNDNISESFDIKIQRDVEDGWYDTNDGYKFYYGDDDDPYIASNVNPEYYWKRESHEWNYCTDSSITRDNDIDSNDYYTISCEEGWENTDGYIANLIVNNLPIRSTSFNIINGSGFPVLIDLNSNVKCSFDFDVNKFNKDVETLKKEMNETNSLREKVSKEKIIYDLEESLLDGYVMSLIRLNEYIDKFKNQKALLNIKYNNGTVKELQFDEIGNFEIVENNCIDSGTTNISGKNIVTHKNCTIRLKKSLQLPNSCLSMINGNAENCVDSLNNQVTGGHKFYTSLNSTGGYVSVYVKNATFFGEDIKLEGEKANKCKFNLSENEKVLFRQIELSDPFIQKYSNRQRKIGENWNNSNLKYDFTNIIKSDIWSKEPEYQYTMSKVDASSVKSNTSSSGVRTYLGENCYFRDDNKFICPFIRPSSSGDGGSNKLSKFFTKIKVSD